MKLLPKEYNIFLVPSWATLMLLLFMQFIVPEVKAEGVNHIQIVVLKHRSATDVLAAIKPHLPEGTVASQQDQNLLLSGKKSTLEQLEVLINALDKPKQSWRVFFSQGQINLQASQKSTTRTYSTARSELAELLVREDAPARLERGFWIPVQTGTGNYQQTGYEWLSGGVWVTVNTRGDQLILNLNTQQLKQDKSSRTRNPSFSGQQFEGEVALQVGQWVTLGSEAQLAAQIPNTSRRYLGGSHNEYYSICIEESSRASCPR